MIHYDKNVRLVSEIPQDAQEWRNNRSIFRWCRQRTLIAQSDQNSWLDRVGQDSSIKMFGVENENNIAVGVCGLTSIDHVNQTAEFSLYIAPKHQGHGYGKNALYTLCRHGYEDLNLWRIWGETFDQNPAAHMFEKLGFKKEGTFKDSYFREGKRIDSHIYGMVRDEFRYKHRYALVDAPSTMC